MGWMGKVIYSFPHITNLLSLLKLFSSMQLSVSGVRFVLMLVTLFTEFLSNRHIVVMNHNLLNIILYMPMRQKNELLENGKEA